MDVRAILLLGPGADAAAPPTPEGVPLPLLDVLGRPLLARVADQLKAFGVTHRAAVADVGPSAARFVTPALRQNLTWLPAPGAALWRTAQDVFSKFAHNGADLVLVLRLSTYYELDYERIIQFHLDRNARVTAATDCAGAMLGAFVISASRRNDAAFLLRHSLLRSRTPLVLYPFAGYSHRLTALADLRQLAVDAFCGRSQIAPQGEEIKPGIWVAPGARIHRAARVLSPAFIGRYARVRAGAVITRCTALERHTEVGRGTVVEDTTVLPYTKLGTALDVAHAVVGFGKVASLRRGVEVEIGDSKLVGSVLSAPLRVWQQMLSLLAYLPLEFARGLLGRPAAPETPGFPLVVSAPARALSTTDSLPATTDRAVSNFQ
jgi:NDP-sugar pyrophosphorylase family protein